MKIRKTTRSTVGHFSRLFVIFVMICISPAAAFAESCYQVGGCVGLIGALRVNKDGAIENGVKLLFGLDQSRSPAPDY